MTEDMIIMALANHGDHIRRYEIMLPNVYTQHDNECDLFCIRKSGLCDEFEVKSSRSDFLADKKKFVQWRKPERGEWSLFSNDNRFKHDYYKPKYEALEAGLMATNYFWYAVKAGVATADDVPPFAGLITICDKEILRIVKSPAQLHKRKMDFEQRYNIARKSTYRFWKLKNQSASNQPAQ